MEDVEGEAALKWVREQNATSSGKLEVVPAFNKIRERLLAVYESDERIPYVNKQGEYFYNFWRDRTNVRGVMRRTTLAEYRKAKPAWEVVLDIDALAQREQENWVYSGSNCLYPDYQRCLIYLSRGGGDTFVVREFDTSTKQFVGDGFVLPAAKSRIAWRDRDTLFVGTNFGADALTDSGYPRLVKSWKRGTPLAAASLVFEGRRTDMVALGGVANQPGYHREFISRQVDFFNNELFLYQNDQLRKLPVPGDAQVQPFGDQALVTLRSAWQTGGKTYEAGALLAMDWERFVDGKSEFVELFKPSARISLDDITTTRNYLLLTVLDNVASRVYALTRKDGKWLPRKELPTPRFGVVSVSAVDEDNSDEYFMTSSDVVTPASLRLRSAERDGEELLKQLPEFYKSDGLTITQYEVASKDGTRVPYFQVASKQVKANGSNPTLVYGYGGFQLPSRPSYNSSAGLAWLEQGGVYVIANIRGGGEFGPQWHQAALKANRQRAYDDFIAVAEDLVKRKQSECLQAQGEERWDDLRRCAAALRLLKGTTQADIDAANGFAKQSQIEIEAKKQLDRFLAAERTNNVQVMASVARNFKSTSMYAQQVREKWEKEKAEYRATSLEKARAAAKRNRCSDLRAIASSVRNIDSGLADEISQLPCSTATAAVDCKSPEKVAETSRQYQEVIDSRLGDQAKVIRMVEQALNNKCIESDNKRVLVQIGVVAACKERRQDKLDHFTAQAKNVDFTQSCPEMLGDR
ncbi:MAG: S9 family peptidase [Myxococcales bacterium]|nr:S9 family peptidase [Myxococcales bacterium]